MPTQNKKVAVLGAGLSGKAAALLLAEEGAKVTVLDSAEEEKLLKHRARKSAGHEAFTCFAVPQRSEDPALYDLGVLSPGIDPDSPLARNFSSRKIDIDRRARARLAIRRVPVIAHHRDKRQDDHDRVARADVECLRPAHRRLRQHRQTAFRSGARKAKTSTC